MESTTAPKLPTDAARKAAASLHQTLNRIEQNQRRILRLVRFIFAVTLLGIVLWVLGIVASLFTAAEKAQADAAAKEERDQREYRELMNRMDAELKRLRGHGKQGESPPVTGEHSATTAFTPTASSPPR